eukprot:scaffold3134_cov414-Prasinococcus_capsulatus_cf.AAC.13
MGSRSRAATSSSRRRLQKGPHKRKFISFCEKTRPAPLLSRASSCEPPSPRSCGVRFAANCPLTETIQECPGTVLVGVL